MKQRVISIFLLLVFWQALLGLEPAHAATLQEQNKPLDTTWIEPLTGMEFVWIPQGCFSMGSPSSEEGRKDHEGPVREVCVDGFWMGVREVSRGEFAQFTAATDYQTEAERQGFSWMYAGDWVARPGVNWANPGFKQSDAHPVVHVSWNDAGAMARWLSAKNEGDFRLPTEAEWEYACRGGTHTARFWGTVREDGCAFANAADLTAQERFPAWVVMDCEDGFVFTAPTGHFQPNDFGLHDMLGNVWEWVYDNYQQDAYKLLPSINPLHQSFRSERIARGGSWNSKPSAIRCANRDVLQAPDRRSDDLGFRLIRKTGNHHEGKTGR